MSTNQPRGFTLLEMTITLGIFSMVAVVAMGALLSLINLDRQARNTNDVVTNLTFAIDTMARSIRTGTAYRCGTSADGNCWSTAQSTFTFLDDQGQTVTYLLRTDGAIGRCTVAPCTAASANTIPLTDKRITIQSVVFYVRGVGTTTPNDALQPQVVFVIKGRMQPEPDATPVLFTVETMATERVPEI